jgi:hypothetical protein
VTSHTALPDAAAKAGTLPTRAPGIRVASIVLGDRARVLGADTGVDGMEAAAIARRYDFR